jgi:serine/threonine-protein kinase
VTRSVLAPFFIALLSLVISTWSGIAAAQRAPNQAAAQALFDEGRKLMNEGKYVQACPKLAESQKLDPGAGTLINLAACYEKAGQTASAWATYKEAIPESDKSNRKEWATKARQRAAALEPTLSKMIVNVPDSARTAGLVVKRDGQEVGSGEWGTAIPVDPGAHTMEASAPGRKPWSSMAQVGKANDTVTVSIPLLEPLPAAAPTTKPETTPSQSAAASTKPPPAEPESSGGSSQRTIGFVVGGVGVVGLAVGAVFGLQAMGTKNDAQPNCSPNFATCNQKGLDTVDDGKSKATISTIGFIAGGALAAGGIALILTAPKQSAPIRVGLADRGVGLSVNGAFR